MRESGGAECDMLLKNNIEGIIIKWAYQVIIKLGSTDLCWNKQQYYQMS